MKLPNENEQKKPFFKLPRILTKEGMREFRKTDSYKQLKYYFAPNMDDKKYLLYNFFLFSLFTLFIVIFG